MVHGGIAQDSIRGHGQEGQCRVSAVCRNPEQTGEVVDKALGIMDGVLFLLHRSVLRNCEQTGACEPVWCCEREQVRIAG